MTWPCQGHEAQPDPWQMLEVYRLQAERWLLLGTHVEAAEVRADPFEALALELGPLWAR